MKTTIPMESPTSPAPGIIPGPSPAHDETAASARPGGRQAAGTASRLSARRAPLASLIAALRGDKYIVDAYPPAEASTKEG